MAFVAIPNNDQYEYDNAPPDPGVGHPMRALWLKSSNGIRTEHGHSNYVRTRRIGSGDVDHGELSKSYWDARGTEDDIQPFAMTVRTTAASETFTIPCQNVGTFNASVDWGDGSSSTVTTYNDANLVHTYTSAGDHAISISGTFPNINFNNAGDRLKVIAVTNLGQVGWQTFHRAFYGCRNMTSFTPGVTDTSSVTDMSLFLFFCTSLTSLDLSSFDTSSVTTMERMIVCQDLTSLDVSGFDTSSVTNMSYMFQNCADLPSITGLNSFDTSSVTDMSAMFDQNYEHTSIDLSSFDTSSVTNMYQMFSTCRKLTSLDVSGFDTSSVTDMNGMFYDCRNITSLDVSSFNTSSVTNMQSMFYFCPSLTSLDVSNFDTSSVTGMINMFLFCTSLTDLVGVENFDIEALNSTVSLNGFMLGVTIPTSRYDALLVNWDAQDPFDGMTPHFGNSEYTAGGAAAAARANLISTDGWTITDGGALPAPFAMTVRTLAANETFAIPCQNVGTFNASIDWGDGSSSTVTTYNDANLAHTYASAGNHAISISGTFPNIYFNNTGDKAKVIAVTNLGQVGWQTFEHAFYGCNAMSTFTPGVTDTSSVTNMIRMFPGCIVLTSLDLSSFDTSSVTDMSVMFTSCVSLTSIDLSGFDNSSVTTMRHMFYNCPFLTSIDLSGFNTSSVIDMYGMFRNCIRLTSLDLSSFDTSSVTNMINMFKECNRITSIDLSSFDTSSVTDMNNMFYGCNDLTSLDLSSFDTSSVTLMYQMFQYCYALTDIIGVENFDIEALNVTYALYNFMVSATIPTSRYDALLINWDAQDPFDNMSVAHFGNNQYTAGGAAAAARANLISTDGWTITDGGTA